ncbi:MAG TPA: ABC transporter permease [Acidimicrobiia bacterium]|jgi:ABC-2 type transport system permease protein
MIALLRTECAKTVRRPRTYVALGFVMAIPVVVALALWANPPDPGDGDRFFRTATQTGLLFPAAMLRIMSRLVLVVVIGLFAGDAIAGEANTGNLRYMLVRPIGRGRLLAAKLLITVALLVIATITLTATATLAGGLAFGFEPISFQVFFVDQSVGNLLGHIGMATAYVSWTLAVVAAFGFMVSTMTDSPAAAAGAAVGLGVTCQILNEIESLGSIRDYLPLRYLDAWEGLFWSDRVPGDMYSGLVLPIPWILAFLAVGWWWFRRKDVLA